jgi:hypothetical protein
MANLNNDELSTLIEKSMGEKDSIKEAVDTLHPKANKKEHAQQSDRLAIFGDTQIDASAVLTWQDKAMAMTPTEFRTTNVSEGFVDKVKALTVSKEGIGRTEIPGVMQPKILGEMLQQGLVPSNAVPGVTPQKKRFISRLFGGA